MKLYQVIEVVRSNPLGDAVFKLARNVVRAGRRLKNPDIPDEERIFTVQYGGAAIPIRHRRNGSDMWVIKQCFSDKQYQMPAGQQKAIEAAYRSIVASGLKPLIIDCGANIGASTLWFAHTYPKAHIVAIEPAPGNFDLLARNTAGLDVDLRRAGIAAHDGTANLGLPQDGDWSYRTTSNGADPEVQMIGFETIMNSKPLSQYQPFILKIDIEGGEANLFDQSQAAFDSFPLIVIEPHDWMMPGEGTSLGFFRFHAATRREICIIGENVGSIQSATATGLHQ